MDFTFNEEQTLIQDQVDQFIQKEYDWETRQSLSNSELGFGDKDKVAKIIERCELLEKETNQILHLTQEIKKLKYSDRLKIIEVLVQVVYADGKMDEFEDNLIRRVCGLVYVENVDVGHIKENTKKKLML